MPYPSGIRLIGAEAWQNCQQLRIVKLPATVVGISDNAFRDCKTLNSVSTPSCRRFPLLLYMALCAVAAAGIVDKRTASKLRQVKCANTEDRQPLLPFAIQ